MIRIVIVHLSSSEIISCNECANAQRTEGKNGSNDEHEIKVGVAIPADVSPNTPKADEADL